MARPLTPCSRKLVCSLGYRHAAAEQVGLLGHLQNRQSILFSRQFETSFARAGVWSSGTTIIL